MENRFTLDEWAFLHNVFSNYTGDLFSKELYKDLAGICGVDPVEELLRAGSEYMKERHLE